MSRRPGETAAGRDERVRASLPIGRVAQLREIADGIVWLASPAASFGVRLDPVDGGATL